MKNKKVTNLQSSKADKSFHRTADKKHSYYFYVLILILIISFIDYLPILHNSFISWDDGAYIQDNVLIRTINLKAILAQYQLGNYHPITMLVYAFEYHLFGLSATGYHAVNLALHLLNTILVFYVVLLLSNNVQISLFVSLLFGIHPLHVESVAWAAELKDLLYTFFFLAAYSIYLKYIQNNKKKFYFYTLILFLLSLFSKAMAASLPVILLLTDYYKGRKINTKIILEKVPFFILAVAFGIVAVHAQKSFNAIQDPTTYSFTQRIIFACYGFIFYLVKLVVPMNLCAYYPYPVKGGVAISATYYIYPLLLFSLIAYAVYSIRFTKTIIFSLGFFAVTVFLVLQLLPVGNVITADRYTYLPSLGIFYLAGKGLYWLWNRNRNFFVTCLISIFTLFFSYQTYARCGVWKNSLTFWNDVIRQYQTVPHAYNNRGLYLYGENKYDEALSDYNKAIEVDPKFGIAYNSRGILLMNIKKQNEEALSDFNNAINYFPNFTEAYFNRGVCLKDLNRYDESFKDLNRVLELRPDYSAAYINRGFLWWNAKKYDEAIADYNKAIELDKNLVEPYYNKAIIENTLGNKEAACSDLQKAMELGLAQANDLYKQLCH